MAGLRTAAHARAYDDRGAAVAAGCSWRGQRQKRRVGANLHLVRPQSGKDEAGGGLRLGLEGPQLIACFQVDHGDLRPPERHEVTLWRADIGAIRAARTACSAWRVGPAIHASPLRAPSCVALLAAGALSLGRDALLLQGVGPGTRGYDDSDGERELHRSCGWSPPARSLRQSWWDWRTVFRPLSATAPRPPAAALTDGELIAILSQVCRSYVEALSAEVVYRSLVEAVPAVEALWRRLSGFGIRVRGASVTISTSSIESLAKTRQAATLASNSKVPWSNPFAISITAEQGSDTGSPRCSPERGAYSRQRVAPALQEPQSVHSSRARRRAS